MRFFFTFEYLPENWGGMDSGPWGLEGEECRVRLIENKSGSGVVEMTEGERAAENARSLDCVGSFAIANDPASLGMTNYSGTLGMTGLGGTEGERAGVGSGKSPLLAQNTREKWGTRGWVIPWMFAVADPHEKWWKNFRGNPKGLGEISQAAFLLKARTLGLSVAIPWGDSERCDFVVWSKKSARLWRVQVKGTARLHRRGYEVQPVHSTRGRGKRRYTAREIDVVVAYVQPVDAWYVIPIEKVGRAKSLRFYPDIESRRPGWEEYREKWEELGWQVQGAGGRGQGARFPQ